MQVKEGAPYEIFLLQNNETKEMFMIRRKKGVDEILNHEQPTYMQSRYANFSDVVEVVNMCLEYNQLSNTVHSNSETSTSKINKI